MNLAAHLVYGVTTCSRWGLAEGRRGLAGRRWFREPTVWWATGFSLLPDALSMWVPFALFHAEGVQGNFFRWFGGDWILLFFWRRTHSGRRAA